MDSYCEYTTIKNMPISERPREKMLTYGCQSLSNAELLAIILSTGTKDKTAIDLARGILNMTSEGLRALTNCTIELMQISSVWQKHQIIAAVELGKRIALTANVNNYKIKSPEDVSNVNGGNAVFKQGSLCIILLILKTM